ncbi:HAD family hydrolase [Alkalicoccobacillus gibsonii]|uniref:HAD family hydrolase n=1 Tax=Alkalicoccobacillus gibsonii TaxID=79881 RepID=A0ABU9VF19_9BACI
MKTILFDFDGTLANTLPVCFKAFQDVFHSFDEVELTDEDIVKMFGPSETGIIRNQLNHTDVEAAIECYYASYSEHHTKLVEKDEDIRVLLNKLKSSGYRLGIITGKAQRSLDISLQALELHSYFDVLISGDDVNKPKPDSEGIELALQTLGAHKGDAIYLGDSDADLLAGQRAHVQTGEVHWLPGYQPTLTVKGDEVFLSTSELLEYLKRCSEVGEFKDKK